MAGSRAAIVEIQFLDWWIAGTGGSGEGDTDMELTRDAEGCPALPGTQVKGTLRDTANAFGLLNAAMSEWLGQEGNAQAELRFGALARLPDEDRAIFAREPEARAALFGLFRATAIHEANGLARTETLRSARVAVPMTVTLRLDWIGNGDPPDTWIEALDRVLALTPAFGKLKNDGMGRAVAWCRPA